ncbi:MAG: hypothetical protein ACSHYB_18990 [Roseibacillus sp.]
MTPPKEHRLYDVILKQVLWDEDEVKIRKRLAVNEVNEDLAEAIIQTARKERIYLLRARSRDTLIKGLVAFLSGCAVLGGFWIRMGAFHIGVIAGSAIFLLAGLGLILAGALGYLAAPTKKGSVADEG